MTPNVFITVRENGRVTARRSGHNTWVDQGREYLAQLVTLGSTEERGIKHIAFGIGGVKQGMPYIADAPPMSVAYPSGFPPATTNGHQYNHSFPINPLIETLERPVRISGNSQPYGFPPVGDIWFTQPPPLGFLQTFTPDEPAQTTQGSVNLITSFPTTLDGKTLILKVLDDGSQLDLPTPTAKEQTITFSSPADAAAVISQIETQVPGVNAELGTFNGLILLSTAVGTKAKLAIVGGTAMTDLGLTTQKVAGSTPGETIFRTVVSGVAGDIVGLGPPNGPFTTGVPLSEVGLFLCGLDVTADFYSLGHLVAYYTFDTILLTPSCEMELFWLVRF